MALLALECEYRVVVAGKRHVISREEMEILRDDLTAILNASRGINQAALAAEGSAAWTDAEDGTLRSLTARNWTGAQIARELPNRTVPAIRSRIQELRRRDAATKAKPGGE